MSVYTNGAAAGDPIPPEESFNKFFEDWLVEQDRHLQELIAASRDDSIRGNEEDRLRPLINRVISHYDHYYHAKSMSARYDVLSMISPTWTSTLEDAFLWIGGWRPSIAFHLLYSKAGLQLEAQLADLLRGLSSGDLGDLSPSQLVRVDELQRSTIKEERKITEKMAKQQETVADSTMVELSHVATEMLDEGRVVEEGVDTALGEKKEGLERILEMADELRLRTLRGVIDILGPLQAVHFLIAAAELHLRIHEWGKRRDGAGRNHH
ncbi:protein DOG1-like 3 isoform X2 [Magnolia sinica]|uniref:protein DOG1-like 3 isoform X2 n=1 Tax=Magnolia sinica TaxID=86752 RepID=UPI002658822B|nr:protein DOG1-like 3 isoform X2 [Magnolia sinica]